MTTTKKHVAKKSSIKSSKRGEMNTYGVQWSVVSSVKAKNLTDAENKAHNMSYVDLLDTMEYHEIDTVYER